uniref:Right handed beta helix domain-containing protein n=1 Tax=Acetithermum autotrophicum TaxID=1446466 RepID=H5SQC6_ACEAU|nr:hypothetical protein HGMM_OP1C057 [Candidatus Acetothermum autotrophicum]
MRALKFFGVGAIVGLLALGAGSFGQVGSAQTDCTVTVQPGESIQRAIDEAAAGAVLCLSAGTFTGNITVTKNLTLRGAGQDQTSLQKSPEDDRPVIRIKENAQVTLADLAIAKGDQVGLSVEGQAQVTLSRIRLYENFDAGLKVGDNAKVSLVDSQVFRNNVGILAQGSTLVTLRSTRVFNQDHDGIAIIGPAQLSAEDSWISSNNITGVVVNGAGIVRLQGTIISRNGAGVLLQGDLGQAHLISVQLVGNAFFGLSAAGQATVTVANSWVVGNGNWGLVGGDFSALEVRDSVISGNGSNPDCQQAKEICNGIFLLGNARLRLIGSTIRSNTDWGLAVQRRLCGYETEGFTGLVAFGGQNIVGDNNISGNHSAQGNPGNHPFANLPPGNVCLPESAQAPTHATIYRAHTPEPVTAASAEKLAQQLLGLEARAVELPVWGPFGPWYLLGLPTRFPKVETAFFVSEGSAKLLLSSEGVFAFYDEARLARAQQSRLAADAQTAQAQFENFLAQKGLQLPEPGRLQLKESSVQSAELTEKLNALGATEAPRYWRLRYRYELPASEHEWWTLELVPTQPVSSRRPHQE